MSARASGVRAQALVEFAIILPILLLLLLGGAAVGLLILNRMELQHAAQQAAIAGADQGGCQGALGVVPQILGYEPDSKSCDERGRLVEVTLTQSVAHIAPIALPANVTVSARAMVLPSASPEP